MTENDHRKWSRTRFGRPKNRPTRCALHKNMLKQETCFGKSSKEEEDEEEDKEEEEEEEEEQEQEQEEESRGPWCTREQPRKAILCTLWVTSRKSMTRDSRHAKRARDHSSLLRN